MSTNINVTEAASHYLKKMIEKEQGMGFRLSIKKTGCSGYAYLPRVVKEAEVSDELLVLPNGVNVFIDTAWQNLLEGLLVDYIEEEKSGLKQKRLTFTNPQEAARCGCGESFTTDESKNA